MVESHTRTIHELFIEVKDCDPTEREAKLQRIESKNPEMRGEVESLLAALDDDPEFLENSPWHYLARERLHDAGRKVEPQQGGHDLPFQRLGAFRLIDRLGAGGMGEVYLAVQEPIGRQVALKVIRRDRMRSFDVVQRFMREVDALSKIRHTNIVTVFSSGEERGLLYFAMDLVPGQSLEEMLSEQAANEARIPVPRVVSWMRDIARALENVHSEGIIHRDVKPANIRITPDGLPMLVDFGIARQEGLSTLTITGSFQGTPHFASPEQIESASGAIDGRTDIYSLGVTLYRAVTGCLPFTGDTTEQIFHRILAQEPIPPRRHDPTLSRDLETVILKAMAKEPARRYESMGALADDLDRVLRGEEISARPMGFTTRCLRRVRRNPVAGAAVGVALASILALSICVPWIYALAEADKRRVAEREADRAKTITDFMVEILSAANPYVTGPNVKVVDALDGMEAKIERDLGHQPEIAVVLYDTLASIRRDLECYDEALRSVKSGLALCASLVDDNHHSELMLSNTKATILERLKRYGEAESLFRDVLQQRRELYGDDHLDTITSINNLGSCLVRQGRHDEAGFRFSEARDRLAALGKHDHPQWHKVLNNLGIVYLRRKEFGEAEKLLRDALAIRKRKCGNDHRYTLSTINNLAEAMRGRGRIEEAEELFRRCLEGRLRVDPDGSESVYTTQFNLASLLMSRKAYTEAESLCTQAYEGFKSLEGDYTLEKLRIMEVLAYLFVRQKKFAEGEKLLLERLDMARTSEPQETDPSGTIGALFALQKLYEAWGRTDKATQYANSIGELENTLDVQ